MTRMFKIAITELRSDGTVIGDVDTPGYVAIADSDLFGIEGSYLFDEVIEQGLAGIEENAEAALDALQNRMANEDGNVLIAGVLYDEATGFEAQDEEQCDHERGWWPCGGDPKKCNEDGPQGELVSGHVDIIAEYWRD